MQWQLLNEANGVIQEVYKRKEVSKSRPQKAEGAREHGI